MDSEKEKRGFRRIVTPVERFDLAALDANNRLWDWDLTTSRIHYSPGWISLLGCAGADFGNTLEEWFKRIHPEDLQTVQREIDTHLSRGSDQFELRHRMLHQDGCYRYMSCRGVITRDDTGRAIRIIGFHFDITSEKVVDPLTGLPNRVLLLDRLMRSIEKAKKREDFLFAVLTIDLELFESGIDRLETINADPLIISFARRLETWLRAENISIVDGRAHLVARSAGDKFIVLLDGLSALSEAKEIADKLLKELLAPFEFNGREVFLSPSIGIALSATGYRNAEEALRDADTALYRAKTLGKSRCEVFDTAVLESTRSRNQLEMDIQEALSRHEFLVFYQPILSLTTNRIAGFEALVRWKHPSQGMVSPMEFIPVAEKSGLIIPLGRWVLQEACRQLKVWKKDPRTAKDLWVSVNLSGMQFMQPSLASEIRGILLDVDLDASGLMLELTESAVMQNPEAARSLLMQLRVMGARIGLDDFGTGYSSLAHLRRFPLDYLKIDCSFIKGIENSADALEIVRTIHDLARQLGLRVIAEGIENSRQLDLLRSLQCEFGQGFLFSKAVDCKQAESLLLQGFVPINETCAPTASPESSVSNDPQTPLIPVPVPIPQPGKKQKLAAYRKYILVGVAAFILLIAGLLVAWLNRLPAPPVTRTPPSILAADSEKNPTTAALPSTPESVTIPTPAALPSTAEKVPSPNNQKRIPAARAPKSHDPAVVPRVPQQEASTPDGQKGNPAAVAPKSHDPAIVPRVPQQEASTPDGEEGNPAAAAAKLPEAAPKIAPEIAAGTVYTLPVVHDHVIGSCKGVLKFDRDSVSFVSEKGKDSFSYHYPEFSYMLNRDQLIIKAGSDTYRFKSSNALNKDDNQSQLSDFYQNISRLYQAPVSK